ncbi:hypothetical protein ADK64_32870 [Streptomyces sp. MMG1121]|nr:hypothetical protein ADK64_32870 [Streptomyces sp. MMG1121]
MPQGTGAEWVINTVSVQKSLSLANSRVCHRKADDFGVAEQRRTAQPPRSPISSSIFTYSAVKRVFRSVVTH